MVMDNDCKVCLIVDEAFRRLIADSRKQVDAIDPARIEELRRKYSALGFVDIVVLDDLVKTSASRTLASYRILMSVKSN